MRGSRNFWMLQIGANATDLWPAVGRIALVTGSAASWWTQINDSSQWQDGVFYFLCAAYGLVSAVALVKKIMAVHHTPRLPDSSLHEVLLKDLLSKKHHNKYPKIQLIRIELRVPEYGWTTQKVFHLLNFIVNGLRAIIFGFHTQVFSFKPKVFLLILLDLPGLLFFSTYTLLVLFWAEIYHQARSLPTDKLRVIYISINGVVYFIQVCIWIFLWLDDSSVVESIGSVFIAVVSCVAALGFLLYGGRLFMMLRRFPIESKGRRKKLHEVGSVTAICFTCFLIRCIVVALSAFDSDASLDVLYHPILDLVYYMLSEVLPSALVLYILRKLPPKRISGQYHPIH